MRLAWWYEQMSSAPYTKRMKIHLPYQESPSRDEVYLLAEINVISEELSSRWDRTSGVALVGLVPRRISD